MGGKFINHIKVGDTIGDFHGKRGFVVRSKERSDRIIMMCKGRVFGQSTKPERVQTVRLVLVEHVINYKFDWNV